MLFTSEQIAQILNGAPATTPDIIFKNMGGAAYYGDVANATYQNMWYTYENCPAMYREIYLNPYLDAWQAGGGSVTPSAVEMLKTEPVVNAQTGVVEGTKAARIEATTTPAGNIKAGALSGRISAGTMAAGVAIGAGIGLKEVATHRQFWEDLGDALIEDSTTPGVFNNTLPIIWRAMEDGSIQSYCDKRDIDKVVQRLYQLDAFNVVDHLDPTFDGSGDQDIEFGDFNGGFLSMAAARVGLGVRADIPEMIYNMAIEHYPGTTVAMCTAYLNTVTGGGSLSVTCYDIPEGIYYVNYDANQGYNIYLSSNEHVLGSISAVIDVDGTLLRYDWLPEVGPRTIILGEGFVYNNSESISNAGCILIPKNPNVIYNGTDQLPPSDPSNFWTTFAAWLANGFTNRSYDPLTNQYVDTVYLPLTAPDINWQIDPITGDQSRAWTGIYDFVAPFMNPSTNPVNNPSPWVFESIGNYAIPDTSVPNRTPWDNNPKFPNPTPTPIGSSPTIAAPSSGVSSGSKLFCVYNPSQANIDALGAYLWTQNVIDLIEKFFSNNPLDAIISLHMIYCTPTTGTNKNIILGYLDSNVSSPVVTSQYETIACGDVNIPELYGNALDYDGVSIQVFLPFIGWRPLKCKEVMGKRLKIVYKIDVYTGTCLALLSVISKNTDQLLYTFEGNCSVQIPLTASDRTRLISGLITAGVSAFTGNPAGAVAGIASIKQDVDRSGSFSGNAGAMGVKKPYLVITRSIDAQATGYNSLYGYPLNKSGLLKNFAGYTRVQSVHVDIGGATDYEKRLIAEKLKNGVII